MKIVVLGGTWFLGRAVAQTALGRGWEVTVFNRGRSGTTPQGARTVRGDRTVADDLARLAGEGPWDAVVDTSASEMAPRDVLTGAHALEPVAGRYVYVSTVNAYRGWPNDPLTGTRTSWTAPRTPTPSTAGCRTAGMVRTGTTADRRPAPRGPPQRPLVTTAP
ncbi:NAD-dependent epimerase/dehydratase family protein [Streptomyces erythrochromogenes]|uniref:NAD-dependent epimerase/dehydratase family protein n=1 Tax=Streptomyces erythrochromogenes TaxID=285574 RepID=UPI0036B7FCFF